MKYIVLASGSKGNVTYFEHNETKFLIDCGISHRQMVQRAHVNGIDINQVNAVFITHEHTDHVAGLDVLMKKTSATCYLTKDTYEGLYYKVKENIHPSKLQFINTMEPVYINDVKITPFSVSHDASDAVGYMIDFDGKRIVYVTDIGYLPANDIPLLQNADVYIFEANYDVTLLFTSNRPFYLKQRIDSVKGHMSNTDSAYNMTKLIGEQTKHIVLIHPSRECNTKEKVIETYYEVFSDYALNIEDYNIVVASQDVPTPLFEI